MKLSRQSRHLAAAAVLAGALALSACSSSGGTTSDASSARGPIKIWYSNNSFEITWGKQVVAAWNAAHPDQQVTAEEIPAGKSSEDVIGAAITAGTEPCLIYNTSPAAVPGFQKQAASSISPRSPTVPPTSMPAPASWPSSTPPPTATTTSCHGNRTL
jgi:ABC-type glycerol-3-phosphate transport system substrate-binding protein